MATLKEFEEKLDQLASNQAKKMDKFGCWVSVKNGDLYSAPASTNGKTPTEDEFDEVSAPQSQGFLDAVNSLFGTKFKMEDFAGR